jgi:hypothetical protein
MTGKNDTASAVVRMTRLPGNSSLEMAYAQNIARTTLMRVALRQTMIELRSAGRNRSEAPPVKMSW